MPPHTIRYRKPPGPRMFSPAPRSRLLLSLMLLALLAGAAGATEPAEGDPPAARLGVPRPDAVPAQPTRYGSTEPAPACPEGMAPEQFWDNLLGRHAAYVEKLGPALGPLPPPPDSGWHICADAGFNMVHTYFPQSAGLLTTVRNAAGKPVTFSAANLHYAVNFGPRVSLGVVGPDGWGVRGDWWRLDEATRTVVLTSTDATLRRLDSSVPVFGVPGFTSPGPVAQQLKIFNDQLAADNRVLLQVADLEAFRNFRRDDWALLVGGGVRYGYLSQAYRAFRSNSGTAKSGTTTTNLLRDSDLVTTGRNFGGVGPTGVVELRRRLGASGFSLYGAARGSVLFGGTRQQSFQRTVVSQQVTVGTAAPKTTTTSTLFQGTRVGDETIPMGDFEVGVNWTRPAWGMLVFVQAGVVDQTWFGSGTATSESGNLGVFGMRFTAGVSY